MAQHNFRFTVAGSGLYFAKSGHDSNAGTGPNEPKKTLSNLNTGTHVVGAGLYTSSVSNNSGTGQLPTIQGDGVVIFNGGSMSFSVGAILKNLILVSTTGTCLLRQASSSEKCKFKSITLGGSAAYATLINSVLIDVTQTINKNIQFQYCVVLNSSISVASGTGYFRDNYLDSNSSLQFNGTAANFRNNNINGIIQLPVTGGSGFKDYAIQDQLVGTPQDNGYVFGVNWLTESQLTADGYTGTVSGWDTAVASCINRDPKFNDVSGEDYTLQADSPHIRRALDGVNSIGGTKIARSVINTDDNGTTIEVNPSTEIDTTVPTSYILNTGETEGIINYIIDLGGLAPLDFIDLKAELKFDSDTAGGSATNENVPDSEPLTADYASKVNTSASATPDLNKIIVPTGLITSGMFVRVAGEVREVTGVSVASPNDTVTVASNFRAIVGSGVTVTYGTEAQIAALNPNRLTYQMRVSTGSAKPVVDGDWDNDLDPSYGEQGTFFTQEWGIRPVYAILSGVVYGGGDSDRPSGATTQEINARWLNVRVYLRDNYSSNGL